MDAQILAAIGTPQSRVRKLPLHSPQRGHNVLARTQRVGAKIGARTIRSAELAAAQRERAALSAKAKAWPGLGPGPHPLSLVDSLRESAQTTAQKLKAAESKLALYTGQLDLWSGRLKAAEAQARLAEERSGGTAEPIDSARRAWNRNLAALRVRALGVAVAEMDARIAIAREERAECRDRHSGAMLTTSPSAKRATLNRSRVPD